jgi:hypothetical protein
VGTRECYLRHIEAKTHGLTKKPALAPYLKEGSPKVLGVAKRGRKGHMSAIEEEVLIGTVMIAGRINDGDVRKTALEKAGRCAEARAVTESAATGMAICFDSYSPRRPFEANASEVAGNNFGTIGMHSRAAMEVASAHRPRGQSALRD